MAIANTKKVNKPQIVEEDLNSEDSSSEEYNDVDNVKPAKDDGVETEDDFEKAAVGSKNENQMEENDTDGSDDTEEEKNDVDMSDVTTTTPSKTNSANNNGVIEGSSSGKSDVDSGDDFGDDEDSVEKTNEKRTSGIANVMAKILATRKTTNVILSKAKKDRDKRVDKKDSDNDTFEVVDETGKVKKDPKIELKQEEEEDEKITESVRDKQIQVSLNCFVGVGLTLL